MTHRDSWLVTSDYAGVRLRPGASQAAFTAAARSLARQYSVSTKGTVSIISLADAAAAAQRAMRPEAVALTIFAGLAALIALVVLVQLLSRQVSIEAAEYPILRALGASRGALAAASLLWVGVVTLAGGLLGTGIAIVASPLMPIGPARLAEPSPGIAVNLAVLGAGLAVTVLVPMLLVLPSIWRAAGPGAGPLGVAEPPNPGRASRLGSALGLAGSLTGGIGVRMALEPGRGRTAVPVRSALAGTVVAVTAVVASAVFGASLLGLVGVPHRYGQNWTQSVDFMTPTTPKSLAVRFMATQPLVSGYALGDFGQLAVNRRVVPAIGVDPVRGHGFVTLLAGLLPDGPGEIALGQQTLRATHAAIGQQVRASISGRARPMRVVGEVVLPAFTEGGSSATDLGQGAVVGTSLLSTPYPPTHCVHGLTCYSFILLRYPAGTPLRAADAHLEAAFAEHRCQISQGCYTLTTDQRPSDIRDYSGVRDTPLLLGALLGLLAVGTLSHALLAGCPPPLPGPGPAQDPRPAPRPAAAGGVLGGQHPGWGGAAGRGAARGDRRAVGLGHLRPVGGRCAPGRRAGVAGAASRPGHPGARQPHRGRARLDRGPGACRHRAAERVMGALRLTLRAELRRRWRPMLTLALLLGITGGVVLTAAAGAVRTDTAYPRLLRWASAAQVNVIVKSEPVPAFFAALRRLPQVMAVSVQGLFDFTLPAATGRRPCWSRRSPVRTARWDAPPTG